MTTITEQDKELLAKKAAKDVAFLVKSYNLSSNLIPIIVDAHRFGAASVLEFLIDKQAEKPVA